MKIQNKFVIAGMIALPLIFAGCASDKLTPEEEKFEKEKKNIIIDKDMEDEIEIKAIRRWETEHGLSKVLIRARARVTGCFEWVFCSYKTLPIAYRFAWYDADGKEVENPLSINWSILNAQYDEELGFNSSSPDKNAKNFKLFIKKVTKENEAQLLKREPIAKKYEEAVKAKAKAKAEQEKESKKENASKNVKDAPKQEEKAPAKAETKGTVSEDVKVPPSAPTQVKDAPKQDEKAPAKTETKKGTVAEDVKVPPSTPTQKKVKTPKDEEAEADAASVRQATPAKPAGKEDKKN